MGVSATVVYTDPMWAVNGGGTVDRSAAALEAAVLGEAVDLRLGCHRDGRFELNGDGFMETVAGADAVVIYRARVTEELASVLSASCKVVARQGVGLDNLNAPLLRERGIYGFHVPDYCVSEVADHTLAMVLALERGVVTQDRIVRADRWSIYGGGRPRRLSELTAGIVGFGRIGRATARRLTAFYGTVLACDPYVPGDLMAGHGVRKRESLSDLLRESDVVLLHCPLNDETRWMIDAAALESVCEGTLIVNTARGELVDTRAVLDALRAGALGGYAADVFSPEDPNADEVNRQLLERDDVVVTAHRAFLSRESERSLRRRVVEEVAHVLRTGEPPREGRVA